MGGRSFDEVMETTRELHNDPNALQDVECEELHKCLSDVPSCGVVVEIGSQLGRSSSIIAQMQNERGFHAIHIDPYTSQPEIMHGWVQMMWELGARFTFVCARSQECAWLIKNLTIDVLFIDGDHTYESVLQDCILFGEQLKRTGVLLAHDYWNEGLHEVKKAVDDYMTIAWHHIGVVGSMGVWIKK